MPRAGFFCAVILAMGAVSPAPASAGPPPVGVPAPKVPVKAPVVKALPSSQAVNGNVGGVHAQQNSFQGVDVNLQNRRDQLQRKHHKKQPPPGN